MASLKNAVVRLRNLEHTGKQLLCEIKSTAFHSFDVCLGGDSEKEIPPQRDPVCRIYAASWQGLLADRGYNIGRN